MDSQKAQRDYVEHIMQNSDRSDFYLYRDSNNAVSILFTSGCVGALCMANPVAALGAGLLSGLYYLDRNFSDIFPSHDRGYLTNHSALRFEYAQWVIGRDEEMASLELDSFAGIANGVWTSPPVAAFLIAAVVCLMGVKRALGCVKRCHSFARDFYLSFCNDEYGETGIGSFLKCSGAFLKRPLTFLDGIDTDAMMPTSFRPHATMDRVVAQSLAKRASLA